jgi:hypothetical protein
MTSLYSFVRICFANRFLVDKTTTFESTDLISNVLINSFQNASLGIDDFKTSLTSVKAVLTLF